MSEKNSKLLDEELRSKTQLLHDLQVHQVELEMQNSQLREAQYQLEEARDRYADLYDYSPVGYLTFDEKGIVKEINLTGAVMLGNERLHIINKPFINYLMSPSIHVFFKHLNETFSKSGNQVAELVLKTKGNEQHIVSMESLAIDGASPVCRTVMIDITKQRQLSSRLQNTESAQDALLNAIPALVYYLDCNLRFLNVSHAFSYFVGMKSENIIGKSFHDIFATDVAEEVHQKAQEVLNSGMALFGYEFSMLDTDGFTVYLSTVLSPYRDPHGAIIGLVGVSIDITHIKTAADLNHSLLMENRRLTRKLFSSHEEERRRLARELHDELGQWFSAIQAEALIICNMSKHNPEIYKSAHSISDSAKKIHEVIRGMLHKLRPSLLDELGLTESLRELVRQWCVIHPDINCVLNLDANVEAMGEEFNLTLYRLIQESLNNIAKHASAKNVQLTITQELDEHTNINVLQVIIEDDGVGFIAGETRSGIGLLGMRERVVSIGGIFSIVSDENKGTKIFVRLPMGKWVRSGE